MAALTEKEMRRLFGDLNQELAKTELTGELYLVGGAVMCLVFQARDATKDVNASFKPSRNLRQAAARVALKRQISEDWLNDSVKGFLGQKGRYLPFLDLSHLKIFTAEPAYLLAMKCLAMRIAEEFHDEEDVRFLLRTLNITSYDKARQIISEYYPLEKFPQKTLYALEEILGS
jgi:hypothetical protein